MKNNLNNQNVTLSLPKPLLKKAKVLAAGKEKSLRGFIKEAIEEKIRESIGYNQAKQRQLRYLKKGFDLGTKGHFKISREEIHADYRWS